MRRNGMGATEVAAAVGVDPKTAERWVAGRLPHRRHRAAVADLLGQSETYLWPEVPKPRVDDSNGAELVTLYPHRAAVPSELWLELLAKAERQIDVLAYAALFLPELDP